MLLINGKDEKLPFGVIKSYNHSFSPYLECFFENRKIENVHMIDARTGMAYVFIKKNGRKLFDKASKKPVLEEVMINMIRLSKEADKDLKDDFIKFVRSFTALGDQRATVYFGIEQ